MAEQRFVRLNPKGLCRRYTVAGRTFSYDPNTRAPQWYTVDKRLAALLEDEVHPANEKPIFEILTEAEWREVARSEVLASMMLRGSVLSGALPAPKPASAPKSGPVAGKYAAHRNTSVGEVDAHAAVAGEARDELVSDAAKAEAEAAVDEALDAVEDPPAADAAPDYSGMTKAELYEAAEDLGVDLSDLGARPTNAQIRAKIEAVSGG